MIRDKDFFFFFFFLMMWNLTKAGAFGITKKDLILSLNSKKEINMRIIKSNRKNKRLKNHKDKLRNFLGCIPTSKSTNYCILRIIQISSCLQKKVKLNHFYG